MARGRPRKIPANLPPHIDYGKVPPGIYWDPSGAGRWYVRSPRPDGGYSTTTVAQASARLSDLHAIAEQRTGSPARGTIAAIMALYFASLAYTNLAPTTQTHYRDYADAIIAYRLKNGTRLGDAQIDRLTPGFIRRLIDIIAQGRPAAGPDQPAIPGYPTKANHWLRFLHRVFNWAREHDHIQTNPAAGVRQVKERADHRMPSVEVFRRVQAFAKAAGHKGAREKGALPPYVWAAMELAYQVILRGIEVRTLTDAHDLGGQLKTNRRKGSRDTLVRKHGQLTEALTALRQYREAVWERHKRPIPIDPAKRYLLVSEDGGALSKSAWHSTWQRLMRAAIGEGIITPEERFALHGLKHRGVTDSKGDKKRNSGHKTDAMVHIYDHELPEVDPTTGPVSAP